MRDIVTKKDDPCSCGSIKFYYVEGFKIYGYVCSKCKKEYLNDIY